MVELVEVAVFAIIAGIIAGAAVLVARRRPDGGAAQVREDLAAAQARLDEARRNFEAQQKEFDERVKTTFTALSAEALKANNEQFKVHADAVLKPFSEKLTQFDTFVKEIEKKRAEAYGGLTTAIKTLNESQAALQKETGTLATALRNPQVRGRWGEIGLERCLELAEMTEHADYVTQASALTEEQKQQRPDAIVFLPNSRSIIIDSKVPLAAYLNSLEAQTHEDREALLEEHAAAVRAQVNQLSAKTYYKQYKESAEFVVLFLRGEVFFSAAVAADPGLLEYAASKKVVLATPTTLISLLRAVEQGWRQEKIAKNAEEIAQLGREMHERLAVFAAHFNKVGDAIDKAAGSYNDAAGSFQTKLLSTGRKFEEHGAGSTKTLPEATTAEKTSRRIAVTGPASSDPKEEQAPSAPEGSP